MSGKTPEPASFPPRKSAFFAVRIFVILLSIILTVSKTASATVENTNCKRSPAEQAYSKILGDSQVCDKASLEEGAETVHPAGATAANRNINYAGGPSRMPSSPGLNVDLLGSLVGGAPKDVFVKGIYAYVAADSILSIIDISNPASPVQVGFSYIPNSATGVYVSGNYAYVAADYAGLRIIDISNPANPTEVGYYSNRDAEIWDVYVSGIYAYVTDYFYGLRIINVSNPANPIEVGYYKTSAQAISVYVSGNYAYVADAGYGLLVLDVSNPATPTIAGYFDTPDGAIDVYISGNYAYVADNRSGLLILDVSNPTTPTEIGYYDTPGYAAHVYISGNYAYVVDYGSGLRIIDVSNPTSPTEVGHYDISGHASGVFVSGNNALIAAEESGLRVIDVSNPAEPSEIGYYDTPGYAYSVYVSGNYAYVADILSGLRIIDVSNPAEPSEIGYYDEPQLTYDVYVSGNYAYLANEFGISIVNVSNPASPTGVSSISTPGRAFHVRVSGKYAYVTGGNGLQIVDVSNPMSPFQVSYYNMPAETNGVSLSGNYAYVTDSRSGLRVIDVSNPASPSEVGHIDSPDWVEDVVVSGNYAYMGGGFTFKVIDVSNPIAPSEVGYYDISNGIVGFSRMYMSGNYIYVADGSSHPGLRVIDVTNPTAPTMEGYYDTPGESQGVFVSDDKVYIADMRSGFWIFKFNDIYPPIQTEWTPPKGGYLQSDSPTLRLTTNEEGDCKWSLADEAYSSMTGDCAGDGSKKHSCDVSGLVEGSDVVYTACMDMLGNKDTATSNQHLQYTVDSSPPATIAYVYDGTGENIDTTISLSQLSANWAATSDPGSGIAGYWYAIGTSAGSSDTVGWTDVSTTTGVTKTGLTLASGTTYFISVKAKNGAGLFSPETVSNGQMSTPRVDTTPPTTIAYVYDGTGADVDITISTKQLSANWGASSDPERGIARYLYAIGTSAGASDTVGWTDVSTATGVTKTGLTLASGTNYFFTVKAENGAGLFSITTVSDGQQVTPPPPPVDVTPPTAVSYIYDGTGADIDITTSLTELSANWSASSDPESGVAGYWYSIGTSAGASDTVGWTDVSIATGVTKTGLTLAFGTTYFFTVKAENGEGLFSSVASSNGVATVSVPTTITINKGWSQIGVSMQDVSINTDAVFSSSYYEILGYNNGFTYLTASGTINLVFATGYWIYSDNNIGAVSVSAGSSYSGASKIISLNDGWNMLSNPYNKELSWDASNAALSCGALPAVYHFDGNAYTVVAPNAGKYILPWLGYWIKSSGACELTISK